MTAPLHVRLLGGLHIAIPEKPPLRFSAKRAEVLLAYLALNRREHSRETLATLLWDDREHKQALANLRALLAQLPKGVRPYLKTSRHVVMFKPDAQLWIDSLAFTELLDAAATTEDLAAALDLYAGPFLDGVFVRESRGLEEWTAVLREQLNYRAIDAHLQIVQTALHERQHALGISHARALLALDPLREQAHRLLMRLLARDKQHNAALTQYETCRQLLADELGVEPAADTTQLYRRIVTAKQSSHPPLPTPATPFMGRAAELTAMSQQLDQPDCRLLTVVGAGGVGKTRLALQVASLRQDDYLHGTYFVPLSTVETAVEIPLALAKSLNLAFQGQTAAESQLFQALANQELLLILDNIEHLLPEAAHFVGRLLAAAPDVMILATSRERLRLAAEHCYELAGLTAAEEAEQFFVACARRVLPDFSPTAHTFAAVRRICRLVDALPLGIELAAAWVHMLSCAEIAEEIEQNISFLAAPQQEGPERHQSLAAVFEYSWRLLAPAEQAALLKLSVFRGGFTRQAAQEVAGANLLMLRSLVDKSLLYRVEKAGDRYGLLEALRQHIKRKWRDDAEQAATLDSHSEYYGRFLQAHQPNLRGQSRNETVQLLANELENCRRAWQTLLSCRSLNVQAMEGFVDCLCAIYLTRSWFSDGYKLLQPLHEPLLNHPPSEARDVLLSRLLARLGNLASHMGQFQLALSHHEDSLHYGRNVAPDLDLATNYIGLAQVSEILGQLPQAQSYAENAHALYEAAGDEEGTVVALRKMASAAQGIGQFVEAASIYQRCLTMCRRAEDPVGIARACNGLGNALADLGQYREAYLAYEESLSIYRQMDNRYSTALVLCNIGTIHAMLEEKAKARSCYEESFNICAEIGDDAGRGLALMNIGSTYEREGTMEKARDLYQQSIRILRQANFWLILPMALTGAGVIFAKLEDTATGRALLHEALQICHENGLTPTLLGVMNGISKLFRVEGKLTLALSLALVVKQHPTGNYETVQQGEILAGELCHQLTAEQIAEAESWVAERAFAEVVTAVLAEIQPAPSPIANKL